MALILSPKLSNPLNTIPDHVVRSYAFNWNITATGNYKGASSHTKRIEKKERIPAGVAHFAQRPTITAVVVGFFAEIYPKLKIVNQVLWNVLVTIDVIATKSDQTLWGLSVGAFLAGPQLLAESILSFVRLQ